MSESTTPLTDASIPTPPKDDQGLLHPVFSSAFLPSIAGSEDLQAVNAALNESATSSVSTVPHVISRPNIPAGSAQQSQKLLPDHAPASGEGAAFFGARSSALKTFDASNLMPKIQGEPTASGMLTPNRVAGIGGKVSKPDYSEEKIVVAMVGLPARGKSYLSNKLMRYLTWLEYSVKVFNVGNLRRSKAKQRHEKEGVKEDHTASYFSHSNKTASNMREKIAEESLDMLIDWLKTKGGNVGIHDATNSTRERRKKIQARVAKEPGLKVIFLESTCDDPAVIAANVELKVSMGDPDYAGMSREDARADFRRRIKQYEDSYEPVADGELGKEEEAFSYLKIINVGAQVTANRIDGYLESRIAYYLMNLHLRPRSIYFSRVSLFSSCTPFFNYLIIS
ncbi:6PF2K-domain-containing protein [Clavulina sp. PMI_390]|nr:6PF2K-domain-containing protein [Clavulina sp. PMI_390]